MCKAFVEVIPIRRWLEEIRKNQQMTMQNVASQSEISESYYSMIENGKRSLSVDNAKKIAVVLGFEWTKFFEDEPLLNNKHEISPGCSDREIINKEDGKVPNESLKKMVLPNDLKDVLKKGKANIIIPQSRAHLVDLTMGGHDNMTFDVSFMVGGKPYHEATVTRCKNGVAVNYTDIYMRRRDPDSMVVADDLPTDKISHEEHLGKPFDDVRLQTFEWFKELEEMIVMPFYSGNDHKGLGYPSLLVCPANAAFFAAALADLQGFIPENEVPDFFKPRAIVYVAPPFRHTVYDGKQVVIHNRSFDMHEIFSYNLYPGPSAKKGIYGVLINIGEQEKWLTLHASTVRVITPYELTTTFLHEGASGGGKSEMIEQFHREADGSLLLGTNLKTGEEYKVKMSDASQICPVTDDMAMSHPSLQNDSTKLVVVDAEEAWFLRVNHIDKYGLQPSLEGITIHPPEPLIFLNMEAHPGATCLLWEHIQDEPGKSCPNPRIIMPRRFMEETVDEAVEVDVRSFGIRTPPSTREKPNYGVIGIFHVLPPALAWLWRLAAPRGYSNPSIVDTIGMQSEGVGSYWPFATGKMVNQANLLLDQVLKTTATRYVLIPNQHIGVYRVGFSAEWAAREYLARRGGAKFRPDALIEARCPILGYALKGIKIDGMQISKRFLQVNKQDEVGDDGYDAGAKILETFFKAEVERFLTPDLCELGRKIVEACLNDASVQDYEAFIQHS